MKITGHNHSNPELLFGPNDSTLLIATIAPTIRISEIGHGNFVRSVTRDKSAIALGLSPDGKTVASAGRDRIILSNLESGKTVGKFELPGTGILGLVFTPDGKTLISVSEDDKVRIWDLRTQKARFVLDGHGWIGRSMAVSKDGKTVALGSVYNVVRVWDVATGKERFVSPDGHDAPVHAVAFSPDGRLLATGGENKQIRLFDSATGRTDQRVPRR